MQEQFGLFVHWGLYALTAYQEQVRARCVCRAPTTAA
jgi:hypothetical protein